MSRHRSSIKDLSLVMLIMLVATFYAWQVDIFATEGNAPQKEQTIEVDELLLGGLLIWRCWCLRFAAMSNRNGKLDAA